MSGYFDLPDLFTDPEAFQRAQQERLAQANDLQRQVQETVGTAKSDDERIVVSYSEGKGIDELTLDPRVLRLPSEELAAEIKRLANAARDDARRQLGESFQGTFGDPNELVEQLPEVERSVDEMMRDTHHMRDELMSILERMRKMTDSSES